jgi:VWFA-related protein
MTHAVRRHAAVLLAMLSTLPVAGAAQAPPQGPTLRASVEQVVVDVVVTDAAGRPVSGLTAADFQVREQRQPQVLATVVEVSAPAGDPAPESRPAAAAPEAAAEAARYYVLLLDDYHVALSGTADVRAAAHAFVDRYAAPGDRIGVLTSSRLGASVVDPTADRAAVHATIDRFVGRGGAPISRVPTAARRGDGGRNADRMASSRTSALSTYDPSEDVGAEAIDRGHDALRALATAAEALSAVPGRKTLLYISQGIAIPIDNDQGLNASVQAALAAAARANVAIYAFDPRGLSHIDPNTLGGTSEQLAARVGQATRDRLQAAHMLNLLAERSGGLAFVDRNDSRAALERVVGDSRHHYLLGYVPADPSRRGRFRTIEVRVARPGVTVRARQGYVEPKEGR